MLTAISMPATFSELAVAYSLEITVFTIVCVEIVEVGTNYSCWMSTPGPRRSVIGLVIDAMALLSLVSTLLLALRST